MFYELDVFDPRGSTPAKRGTDFALKSTFEGSANFFAHLTRLVDRKAELSAHPLALSRVATSMKIASDIDAGAFDIFGYDIGIPGVLPDG